MGVEQTIRDFEQDAKTAEEAVTTKKVVTPRTGDPFKALPLIAQEAEQQASQAIEKVIENGMIRGFATETILKQWTPDFNGARAKADDTGSIYRYDTSLPADQRWVNTGMSDLDRSRDFINQVNLAPIIIPPSAGYPTFNTKTKTLSIPINIIIQYFGSTYAINTAYNNTFTNEGFYRIYFNTISNTYKTVDGSGVSVNSRDFLIAVVRISNTYNHDVTMSCEVVYNGQRANDLTQKFCAITNSALDVVNNLKSYPFYNTTAQTLTFFRDTVFSFANYEYALSADVAVSKPDDAGTIWKIFLDITTNTFIAKNYTYNTQFNEKMSWVLVAVIRDARSYGAKYRVSISMMSDYYVDGKINDYQYVEHVDTTADLIAMPVYDGQKVYVKQWRTESNGRGGGLWEFKADNTDAQNRVDTFISSRTSTGRWKKIIHNNTVTAYDAGLVLGEGLGLTNPINNATFWTDFLQTNRTYKCYGLLGELIFDPSAYHRDNKVQTIAHRGFYAYHPENTMLAFSSAVESGADVLEVDTQLTSNGVFVCYHDATLDTLTNLSGKIDEKTYAEVKLAKFKALENTRFYDSIGISKLENLLKFARSKGVKVNIECNNYNYTADTVKSRATVSALVDLIVAMNMEDQVTISSFTRDDLFYLRTLNKNIRAGMLRNAISGNGDLATAIKWCAMLGNAVLQTDKTSSASLLQTFNKYVNPIELWTSFKNQDVAQKIEQGFTKIIADVAHGE